MFDVHNNDSLNAGAIQTLLSVLSVSVLCLVFYAVLVSSYCLCCLPFPSCSVLEFFLWMADLNLSPDIVKQRHHALFAINGWDWTLKKYVEGVVVCFRDWSRVGVDCGATKVRGESGVNKGTSERSEWVPLLKLHFLPRTLVAHNPQQLVINLYYNIFFFLFF